MIVSSDACVLKDISPHRAAHLDHGTIEIMLQGLETDDIHAPWQQGCTSVQKLMTLIVTALKSIAIVYYTSSKAVHTCTSILKQRQGGRIFIRR